MFSYMSDGMMHCGILTAQVSAAITTERGSFGLVPLGGGLASLVGTFASGMAVDFYHLRFESANDNQAQRIAA